ncbi:MAG: haloacid dehalogenase-like hydrolase [Atopobiaceae bacterium]|nr:haloacid dehalogenase-like hydrolase [Atopobiaceae bacterium]
MADTQQSKQKPLVLVLAFALGAVIAALVCLALPKTNAQPEAKAEGSAQTEGNAQVAADVPAGEPDVATVFPSWDPNSASLKELIAFVTDVCDPASPNYKEPSERIATFDMDGTIICEKAPIYVDYMLLLHRVLDDPQHEATPDVVELCESIRDYAMRGEKSDDNSPGKHVAIAHEFAGMTQDEFRAYVTDFLATEPVVGFDGMTYGQSFYLPMLEVIKYLQANDFDVWMVSACEREVVRAAVAPFGIAPDHVIATDVAFATTGQGDKVADDYTMEQDEQVVLAEPLDEVECGKNGKVLAIAREIGSRPLLSFGNSSGDYAMLNYAEASGGMGLYVVCDDLTREYGDEKRATEEYELAKKESWTTFSMANDWATIYGEGVTKTELPGLAEQELAEAA